LTGDLVRPRLRRQGSTLQIELIDVDHPHWLRTATELIGLFQSYVGRRHEEWTEALEIYEGERIDYIVLRGLAKTLADEATFTPAQTARQPVEIRDRLFARGPVFARRDLFHRQTRNDILRRVSKDIGLSPDEIQAGMFADQPARYVLTDAGP